MAKSKKSERASTSKDAMRDATTAGPRRRLGAFQVLTIGSHCSYMKAHEGEDNRTMFLVNLPTDTTDRHLKAVFAGVGAIQDVKLWQPNTHIELGDEEDDRPVAAAAAAAVKGKEAQKQAAAGPPAIIPLPSLDPRSPHHLLPTATSAHITFLDESSLQRALTLSNVKSWPDPWEGISSAKARLVAAATREEEEAGGNKRRGRPSVRTAEEAAAANNVTAPPLGLNYLLARHQSLRPSLDLVKAHVDSVIANYEYRRAHPTKKDKAFGIQAVSVGPNGEMLDEDGFIIVQSTGKYGRTSEGQVGASIKVARRRPGDDLENEAAREKKKKRFELDDFYRFQRREQKREELANLRAKFQEDQEKVKKLKSSRSFKPF